ncbi:hypothetical protein [Paenibacillus sp. HW567]|uniref:hypothetical protein n=1 Tax=Paenibacillus sp. HW567 TaxID=1034769 RepID=UPI0003655C1D|nr:hypothetical protein [Paenibacillus sp. HW567]
MRKALLTALLMALVVLSACGNNSSAPATHEEVQQTVQNFYNEMAKFDEMGKSSLESFNTTLTSYSTGKATDKELEKAIDKFQDTTSDIAGDVKDVKVSTNLPENIQKLLRDSIIAFQSAYSIKEQASKSAVSPNVTAEQFNDMNKQADVAMLYGISKLNEARVAAGLIEAESSTNAQLPSGTGTVTGTATDTKASQESTTNSKTDTKTTVTDVK